MTDVLLASYWIGKVAGSQKQIDDALRMLKNLNKEINAKTVQSQIIVNIEEGLRELLTAADEQHQYTPYYFL
jgi:hypothetical protein